MNELALFAGAGGGILGGTLLGWRTVAAVEIEEYPRAVLLQRQLDGILPRFPIWGDVRTFDGKPWRGRVDVITAGFPCQDISAAGEAAGINGERSGLWFETKRVVSEIRPSFAFLENSPLLTSRGLGTVLGDLAEIGYDAEWIVLGGRDIGGRIERKRIFILGYNASAFKKRRVDSTNELQGDSFEEIELWSEDSFTSLLDDDKVQYSINSEDERMGDGVPYFMERFSAIGNAQIPIVAALAFMTLYNRINNV